jgi:hypothetical protein
MTHFTGQLEVKTDACREGVVTGGHKGGTLFVITLCSNNPIT